jgi:hypothetical protein
MVWTRSAISGSIRDLNLQQALVIQCRRLLYQRIGALLSCGTQWSIKVSRTDDGSAELPPG